MRRAEKCKKEGACHAREARRRGTREKKQAVLHDQPFTDRQFAGRVSVAGRRPEPSVKLDATSCCCRFLSRFFRKRARCAGSRYFWIIKPGAGGLVIDDAQCVGPVSRQEMASEFLIR